MNIKDIILKIKNRSITEIYEKSFDTVHEIDSIYVDKFVEKYSYTKEKKETERLNEAVCKHNKKMASRMKISYKKSFLSCTGIVLSLSAAFFAFYTLSPFVQQLELFRYLMSSGLSIFCAVFIYAASKVLYKESAVEKIKENKYKIFKNSEKYINSHYKEFFSNITFDLINELDLITEPELQKEKENIKKYLIKRAYYLDKNNNVTSNDRHTIIKQKIINKMFIEELKPLNNKILKETKPESSIELDNSNEMLKELKVKFNEKIPVI